MRRKKSSQDKLCMRQRKKENTLNVKAINSAQKKYEKKLQHQMSSTHGNCFLLKEKKKIPYEMSISFCFYFCLSPCVSACLSVPLFFFLFIFSAICYALVFSDVCIFLFSSVNKFLFAQISLFLSASSHFYKRSCPSVGWLVGWSVGR